MIPTHFAHIAINATDPIQVERFYTKHFGFRRIRVIELGADQIVFTKSGGLCFEIFRATAARPVPPADKDGPTWPGHRHIAFQVDDVEAKLAEMGADAHISLGPLDFSDFIPGWKTVWVTDPEGNIVEITQGFVEQDNPPALPA
jgi:glyoxylase I family protein